MKRVAVVAVCDYQSQPNGGEVFLLNNLFSELRCSNVKYCLIGMTFDPELAVGKWTKIKIGNQNYDFLPVAKVLKEKEQTHIPFRLRCVLGELKYRKKIAEIGAAEFYIHSAELCIPMWNNRNASVVYHVHGDPSRTLKYSRFPVFRGDLLTKAYFKIINRAIKKSRRIIWAARKSEELYLLQQPKMKKIIESKSCVIHSSFDTKLINGTAVPEIQTGKKHLVTVGRLAKIKRLDFILPVLREIRKDGYDVDLIICGDGEERARLEAQAEQLEIQDRVLFMGNVGRAELATILDSSEVFLFASENEAMSLVVLESLYMGTPVVSTDVGDISDVVKNGETGYILSGYHLEPYKNKVEEILKNGKLQYYSNCCKAALKYTPKAMAESVNEVFEKNDTTEYTK